FTYTPPDGSPAVIRSPEASVTLDVFAPPVFTLTKTGPENYSSLGETLTYTLTVANTGTVTIAGTTVTDPLVPGLDCVITALAPGASGTCTAAYQVTQADLDSGT